MLNYSSPEDSCRVCVCEVSQSYTDKSLAASRLIICICLCRSCRAVTVEWSQTSSRTAPAFGDRGWRRVVALCLAPAWPLPWWLAPLLYWPGQYHNCVYLVFTTMLGFSRIQSFFSRHRDTADYSSVCDGNIQIYRFSSGTIDQTIPGQESFQAQLQSSVSLGVMSLQDSTMILSCWVKTIQQLTAARLLGSNVPWEVQLRNLGNYVNYL